MYTNRKGETSVRFTDYNYTNQKDLEEEEVENTEQMNIHILSEKDFEVDKVIEQARKLNKENNEY